MIPVKRRRGRPKKIETSKTDLEGDASTNLEIIASAVDQAILKRKPRRTRKRVASDEEGTATGQDDGDDGDDDDDDEFVPEINDLVVVLDEPENDAKTKKIRRVKRTKTKASGPRSGTPGSTLEEKGRVIRALKDLSAARDKIERIYGLNQQKLLNLAKVKEGFETSVFCFPRENIQTHSPYFVNIVPPCASDDVYEILIGKREAKVNVIAEPELSQMFKRRNKGLRIVIGEAEVSLNVDQKTEFPILPYGERVGFVYNTGGLITDMAWLKQEDEQDQYLAVSLSQYFDKPSDRHLRMFNPDEHVSCIEIFRLNPDTLAFTKVQTIVHTFGETWNLRWHEGCRHHGSTGSLMFACQDGTVKLLEVTVTEEYAVKMFEQPSLALELPKSHITCYDFLSPTRVVCGFKNGYIAEFDLTDPTVPVYYRKMHDSYVISIVVSYSEFEDPVVATVSVDGYFYLFNPRDIFTSKTTVTRFRGTNIIPISYIPQLYALINSDGANSLKTVVPRAAFAIHPVSSQETSIVSIGTSRLHPLSLSGSSDGSLIIDNIARRLLTGIKNGSLTHTSLRLWKWEYSKAEDKYRLNHAYETYKFAVNEVSGLRIDPHGINISCVKWNETPTAGQFYAFANSAGLLTVEKLNN